MQSHKATQAIKELRQFITFGVGDQEYGLELLKVREVIRVRNITWLPKAPAFVKGIINLRGDVIPVIDLGQRFGLKAVRQTDQSRVVVVEVEGQLTGLEVDSASQVARIPVDQIEPPPSLGANQLIAGVGKLEDSLVLLLDPDAILTASEKETLSQIEALAAN